VITTFRIGLVMQGGSNWIGGVEYIKNIVFALATLPVEVRNKLEICIICEKSIDPLLYEPILSHLHQVFYVDNSSILPESLQKMLKIVMRESTQNIGVDRFLKSNPEHGLNFIYPYTSSDHTNQAFVTADWIPDFQHKCLPHLFNFTERFRRDNNFKYIFKKSPLLVFSSKCAEQDSHKFFPDAKLNVKVLPFTMCPPAEYYEADPIEVVEMYSLPSRFFLVSNQFWKHKNHKLVFKAMGILKQMNVDINVVFTGKLQDNRDRNYSQEIEEMIRSLQLESQVYLLGLIPKKYQVQLIRTSLAMVQPSLFEGWNTSVEEARCLGKKIALSDIPVHLEQNPPRAAFFKKDDPSDLANILKAWWESEDTGFNLAQENIAREKAFLKVQEMAYKFLDIAGYQLQQGS
jgi:glycosyltransferase involved in cell wall biosynthesis